MESTFQLQIVTPDGVVFEGMVEELLAPGALGEFGVLPGHIPFLTSLEPGPLAVREGGKLSYYAVHGGFCQVCEGGATVLADLIEPAGDIDRARAQTAKDRAEEALKTLAFTAPDYDDVQTAMARARARLAATERGGHA